MKGNVISGIIKINPIAKTGVSEVLVDQLLGFVAAGQLKPGDKLPPERDLAMRFAVSRPTVREALRALSVIGVIEIRHGGGAFVSALKADDLLGPLNFFLNLSEVSVEKLYDARRLIEGEICALAASRATEENLTILAELIEKQEAAIKDSALYLDLDSQFHEHLGEISDNPFLLRAAKSLNVLGVEFRKTAVTIKSMLSRSISDHKKILSALKAKDPEAARVAMVAHMEQVLATTTAGIKGKSDA